MAIRNAVVTLMEVDLCMTCRFSTRASVRFANGSSKVMVGCKRRDCDNWQVDEAATAQVRGVDWYPTWASGKEQVADAHVAEAVDEGGGTEPGSSTESGSSVESGGPERPDAEGGGEAR